VRWLTDGLTRHERWTIYFLAGVLGVALGWWIAYTIGFTL
jgi:hypothetical protein